MYGYGQMMLAGAFLANERLHWSNSSWDHNVRQVVHNSVVESFLTNSRRIAYFLHAATPDEAFAADYTYPDPWAGWPDAGKLVIGTVSNTMSHAKYLPKPPPHQIMKIMGCLMDGMSTFIDRLGNLGSRWHTEFAHLRVQQG